MTNYDILKEYEAHQTPVPSYEEWKAKLEENAQLKELLKECKMPLKVYNELFGNKAELLTKIDEALQ